MKKYSRIRKDFICYKNYSGKAHKVFFSINFYCVVFYRISNYFYEKGLFAISKIFWFVNRLFICVDIDPGAKIKGDFLIVHGIGLVIGRDVQVNGSLKIYHGATLGGNFGKKRIISGVEYTQPILGDNVIVGINSSVLGPVKIGDNVIIATGAIVTKDVPSNSIVKGVNHHLENNLDVS